MITLCGIGGILLAAGILGPIIWCAINLFRIM